MAENNDTPRLTFTEEVRERCKKTKVTRWIRFGIVAALYTAWVVWMNNYWFLLGLPLLFDIYITGFIPFTWWKKSKNPVVRTLMSWVDAIVYALILVYFVFNFVGQNYQIPSSSLEKTLLTGDYLWVNKMVYGPRVPITPVHFPLVHNTMPFTGSDSYLDWPENGYRRLKGLRNVELGDIVVFNFPAGDTVAVNIENDPNDSRYYEELIEQYGWAEVNTNKGKFGEIKYRPVDRRVNFVKRAVGLPGQRFKIVDNVIYLDGVAQPMPKNAQFRYVVALRRPITEEQAHDMGITISDILAPTPEELPYLRAAMPGAGDTDYVYVLPLTEEMKSELTRSGQLSSIRLLMDGENGKGLGLFPKALSADWTLGNYGGDNGILIPKKGMTVKLTPDNWELYKRVIRNYEGHTDSYIRDGKIYVDGKPADTYTFAMDYYFMMGDNRDMSQDSRFWGFVPEDHIVGTPMFVAISFDQERGLFDGKIRWNRIFIDANPDK